MPKAREPSFGRTRSRRHIALGYSNNRRKFRPEDFFASGRNRLDKKKHLYRKLCRIPSGKESLD